MVSAQLMYWKNSTFTDSGFVKSEASLVFFSGPQHQAIYLNRSHCSTYVAQYLVYPQTSPPCYHLCHHRGVWYSVD